MLKRRKPPKMNVKEAPQIRCAGHLQFVRGFECAARTAAAMNAVASAPINCHGGIEAAHVRVGTDGALGVKPSDCWAIPLCAGHHLLQHSVGEVAFERTYKIDMKKIASELWAKSPHGQRYRAARAEREK